MRVKQCVILRRAGYAAEIRECTPLVTARDTRRGDHFAEAIRLTTRARKRPFHRIDLRAGAKALFANVRTDRKSTRLNSSHLVISYAVFCLKKKKNSTRHKL